MEQKAIKKGAGKRRDYLVTEDELRHLEKLIAYVDINIICDLPRYNASAARKEKCQRLVYLAEEAMTEIEERHDGYR